MRDSCAIHAGTGHRREAGDSGVSAFENQEQRTSFSKHSPSRIKTSPPVPFVVPEVGTLNSVQASLHVSMETYQGMVWPEASEKHCVSARNSTYLDTAKVIETEERPSRGPERRTGKKDRKVSTRYYYTKYPIVRIVKGGSQIRQTRITAKTRCVISNKFCCKTG